MISIFQLILVAVGVLFLTSVIVQFKRDKITTGQAFIWGIVWIFLIVSTFFVQYLGNISQLIGISRPIDIIVYSSIILLFIYMYHIQLSQVKLAREMTEIVRTDAIKRMKK